jgi:hypothetical protein
MEPKFTPFVGLTLWYWPGPEEAAGEMGRPLAATVAAVLDDGRLSLAVLDPSGRHLSRSPVPFVGPDDPGPGDAGPNRSYCSLRPDQLDTLERGERLPAQRVPDAGGLEELSARLENAEAKLAEVLNNPASLTQEELDQRLADQEARLTERLNLMGTSNVGPAEAPVEEAGLPALPEPPAEAPADGLPAEEDDHEKKKRGRRR